MNLILLCINHTQLDARYDSSGRIISPSQSPLPTQDNTTYKHKRQTSMPLSGIQTRDPSNQVAAHLCLKPRGHRDRLVSNLLFKMKGLVHISASLNCTLIGLGRVQERNVTCYRNIPIPGWFLLSPYVTISQFFETEAGYVEDCRRWTQALWW
jgi:hypothetical protein